MFQPKTARLISVTRWGSATKNWYGRSGTQCLQTKLQRLYGAKQQSGCYGKQRVPACKNGNRQTDKAPAGRHIFGKGADDAAGQKSAADTGHKAAKQVAKIANPFDADTCSLRCLRIFACGLNLQTELGAPHDIQRNKCHNERQIDQDILLKENLSQPGNPGKARNGDGLQDVDLCLGLY